MVSTTEMLDYIRGAEQRFQSGQIKDGSHAAGVFVIAARNFESIVRQKLKTALDRCDVDYESRMKASVRGKPSFTKLTLGQIARVFAELDKRAHAPLLKCFRDGVEVTSFVKVLREVNRVWVEIKHKGKEVPPGVALKTVQSMIRTLEQLAA